ncbi:MAG: 30S ribosomal protein S9 [Nanoarchaeota archaeon]|nr:30S ribosomal protein S9 [Nanoarchaeota archaeon]MBU1854846.1 30S ribosomal protein S9 [Nanoarchaeota archaeon]
MKKAVHKSGKRKRAIARATLKQGTGKVKINKILLDYYEPKLVRMKIKEPLILAENIVSNLDINVSVRGGGCMGQADAIRLAIGRVLSNYKPELKKEFLEYDRQLLVADIRRKECSKPNSRGQARAKRQKSYR